jgi:hypothetical protein
MHIHPSLPYADDIRFDELEDVDIRHASHLVSNDTVYITEFKANGNRYGCRIVTRSQEQAEKIAFGSFRD